MFYSLDSFPLSLPCHNSVKMKFRTPTFQVSRDPNEDGFKPMPFKMPTMPVLREKKSRPTLVNGNDSGTEGAQSRPGTGFLKRKQSMPNMSNGPGDAGEIPPMPPTGFLRKKSMPSTGNGMEDPGESPPVPPTGFLRKKYMPSTGNGIEDGSEVPTMPPTGFLRKKKSMPNLGSGADDGRDGAQSPAMKQALRDLLQKTGTNLREKSAKLENRMPHRKPKEVHKASFGTLMSRC